jgi:DNA-binding XRE family transcriptional regulator
MVSISNRVSLVRTHGNAGNLGNLNSTFPLDMIKNSAHQDADKIFDELLDSDVYDAPSFLKYLRNKKGVTQRQFAQLMGIKFSRYQQLETGTSQNLTIDDCKKLEGLNLVDKWIFDIFITTPTDK